MSAYYRGEPDFLVDRVDDLGHEYLSEGGTFEQIRYNSEQPETARIFEPVSVGARAQSVDPLLDLVIKLGLVGLTWWWVGNELLKDRRKHR